MLILQGPTYRAKKKRRVFNLAELVLDAQIIHVGNSNDNFANVQGQNRMFCSEPETADPEIGNQNSNHQNIRNDTSVCLVYHLGSCMLRAIFEGSPSFLKVVAAQALPRQ